MARLKKLLFYLSPSEIIFFLSLFVFSSYLMFDTFRVNSLGNLELATRLWSDFAATIPLIRSFSYGSNFPPEYPIFAGPPIRYHFIFYMFVGYLEKVGIRIDLALNSLSILGFFILCVSIYFLGKIVFKNKLVGLLSVVLFLFNGSWGFLEFFKKHPFSPEVLKLIVKNTEFTSFGPYDGKIVSAFWSLNIFTNQRHLTLAYAAFIFLILLIYQCSKKPERLTWMKVCLIGITVGVFPFLHMAVFGMMLIALFLFFLIYPNLRLKLFIALVITVSLALPQLLYMGKSEIQNLLFHSGYLVQDKTISGYLTYWFFNLGIATFLYPLGFILANKEQRKIFLVFFALFVVGNFFQFSPEIAANHKFFNLFVIGANTYASYLLVILWRKKIAGKIVTGVLLVLLTLTGIIDLFPILNDRYITLEDIPNNKVATFINKSTPKDAVFLNGSYLFDPASLAGRKIYLGWPYFSWSAGYDTTSRNARMKQLLSPSDKRSLCDSLAQEKIDYIELQNPTPLEEFVINYKFFEENFQKILSDTKTNITIYDVNSSCV